MKEQANPNSFESKSQAILEHAVLLVYLCVIACRLTYTEGPLATASTPNADIASTAKSLILSAVLITAAFLWLIFAAGRGYLRYRYTGIEIGLVIFALAGVLGITIASNRRAAIIDLVTLVCPIVAAIVLVQILNSHSRIKLVLIVLAALGVLGAYQCLNQFLFETHVIIAEYEKNPQSMLAVLGIEKGSLNHMLFKHRLYSKDIYGFFTTGNSAGCFALLAASAAIAILYNKLKTRQGAASADLGIWSCGIGTLVIIFGLLITQSKGAIIAALIGGAMLVAYITSGNWLRVHGKMIAGTCLVLAATASLAVATYGIKRGTLPGGNSMLVRWQYWVGAAKMYADHPITGVGPGNFAMYYPRYKDPAAPETVKDPHSFPLAILTQYGPIGLMGFLTAMIIPLWLAIFGNRDLPPPSNHNKTNFIIQTTICSAAISLVLLVIRPYLLPVLHLGSTEEKQAAALILYVVPTVVFAAASVLFFAGEKKNTQIDTKITKAVLICAVIGVLIHNLIDFAIFEPGIYTTLWVLVATTIALSHQQTHKTLTVARPSHFATVTTMVVAVLLTGIFLEYALLPVTITSKLTTKAVQTNYITKDSYSLLAKAARADLLDPGPLNLAGRLYLQSYTEAENKKTILLEKAAESFLGAIGRDKANFKNYEKLSDTYNLLAQNNLGNAKTNWLNKTFMAAQNAVGCYPGCERLHFKLAQIAEQLQKTNLAIEHYKKVLAIEDSFRKQFTIMYPGDPIVSRLGEDNYEFTKKRVKELSTDDR